MSLKKRILTFLLSIIMLVVGSGLVYGVTIYRGVLTGSLSAQDLHIKEGLDGYVANVAVFGVDGRDGVDGDRSDTIMIVSINFNTSTVKITSIMRDMMARIPGDAERYDSYEKINAAYEYGGPQLAVKALNQNFDLNIKNYATINFDALVHVVEAVGGVDVHIENESVLEWLNKYIDDTNAHVNRHDPHIESIGPQHLSGSQALAYSRIRFSDNDYKRTERQREVVGQILKKSFELDLITGISLMSRIYPYVETSMTLQEITSYAKLFMNEQDKTMETYRVPDDGHVSDGYLDGVSFVFPNNLEESAIALHRFIYGAQTDYQPSATVKEISDYIANVSGFVGSGTTMPVLPGMQPTEAPDAMPEATEEAEPYEPEASNEPALYTPEPAEDYSTPEPSESEEPIQTPSPVLEE
ncbi:MAG: LCP family protein [Eubacteriaceae bacterium]|nr:LCP family protein [Eubacteriaceae bacterium]